MYSEMTSGYERGEDPFTYHNGGTRQLVTSVAGSDEGSLNRSIEFERLTPDISIKLPDTGIIKEDDSDTPKKSVIKVLDSIQD